MHWLLDCEKVKSVFMMFPPNGFHFDKRDLWAICKGCMELPLVCAYCELMLSKIWRVSSEFL